MKNITRWHPDTCKCQIDVEWDVDNPELQTHTIVGACAEHASHTGPEVLLENQTKNKAMQIAAEASADFAKLTDEGHVIPNLSKITYSFDSNRKMSLVAKVASSDILKVQAELDAKLGSGKVSIG